MAAPKEKIWPLEPHTRGKHDVLRAYLGAWLPIMARWNRRILFIDGFAGPGVYANGEEGSPIIAMRTLVEHTAKNAISAEIGFLFVESDADRAGHLTKLVAEWKGRLPKNCWARVAAGKFDDTISEMLDEIDEQNKHLAPSFVMIDPFGVKGIPFTAVERILGTSKCEVYVSIMYGWIRRFEKSKQFEQHLDDLFGTRSWRDCASVSDPAEKQKCYFQLYEDQLRKAGANHVVHFDLLEGGRLVYSIFFGTQHWLGADRFKAAVWKVAPFGDFAFQGSHISQPILGIETPDFEALKQALREEFSGKDWVSIEHVEEFTGSDRTDFHTGQLRSGALIPMEKSEEIDVDGSTRKRRNAYPKKCRIRFP